MTYSEGAHDSPADTKDRLVRVGSKYQATLAEVADGDNVYLAVSSTGKLKIDPIEGDVSLRASAVAGEANGTSTAVDNLGWVKSFVAVVDVTAVPTGGSPTLDVYIQTQLPNGDWQDLTHCRTHNTVEKDIIAWGPANGNFNGIGAEGSAVTYDRVFAGEDAALAASNVRVMPMGDSLRVKWVFAAGGSSGDFTFSVDITPHS